MNPEEIAELARNSQPLRAVPSRVPPSGTNDERWEILGRDGCHLYSIEFDCRTLGMDSYVLVFRADTVEALHQGSFPLVHFDRQRHRLIEDILAQYLNVPVTLHV